jgi:outer membrane protein
MIRSIRCFVICGITLIASTAMSLAEESPPNQMNLSLAECIEIALGNSSQIVQDRYNVALSEVSVDDSRNAFLPSASVSWGASRSIQGPREGAILDRETGVLITSLGESRVSGGQSVSLAGISIPLYNAQNFANLSANKLGLKATRMSQSNNRQQTIYSVKQNYFNLLKAVELLEVQKEQIRVSKENLRRQDTLYEIGSTAILNVFNARSTLASSKVVLINRENNVEIARANLSFFLGLGPDVNLVPTQEQFEMTPQNLSYENVTGRALDSHPDLLRWKYTMEEARTRLKGTQRNARLPSATMSASYSWSLGREEQFLGLEDLFLKNYSYTVSVNVRLPVFNMGTENSIRRQKLQYLRTQEQFDQAKRQRIQQIRQSYLSLERTRRLITANEAAVKAAEESFKLVDQRYTLGGGTFLERQTEEANLFRARSDRVSAIYDYQIELAQFQFRTGIAAAGE